MGDVTVMFTLPDNTFAALQAKARREGTVPGAILRDVLLRDLCTRGDAQRGSAAEPALVTALRTLLVGDFIGARNWADLSARLADRGYALRFSDGRLALFSIASDERLADATAIGAAYGALIRRFGEPMPDAVQTRPQQVEAPA